MRMPNGDLPRWAVKLVVWVLTGIITAVGVWISGLPALGSRVTSLEQAQKDVREEIRQGFRALTDRIDYLMRERRR